jgi:hypothetical protein
MFDKKITNKDKAEIGAVIEYTAERIVDTRIKNLIKGIDFNGEVSASILNFLLEKSGYMFFQKTGELTEKELKSLGDYKEFNVKGVDFLIAKKDKVIGKKTKKIKKTKKSNK